MSESELVRVLLKAVRLLPQEEQDIVLGELLAGRYEPDPRVGLAAGLGPPLPAGPRLVELIGAGALSEARLERETSGPLHTVPVRLPAQQYERLKQWCQANDFTMAVVFRGLVARFLDERAGGEGAEAPPPA
jgi:hypothetical protein